jgi:iron complex outermembrane receptor protein
MALTRFMVATSVLAICQWSSSALAQVAAAPPAQAAPAASDETQGVLGEIVVTARRREEALSRVPVAVSAFDQATLDRRQVYDTASLTKVTPGLNYNNQGTRTAPIFNIRGQSRATSGGGTPGVLVYMNEVPLPTYGTYVPTFDMGNVQVLKGPQGTLFGRNAVGGAILLNTAPPTHEFGGYVEGSFGNHADKRFEGAINVPLVKDVFSVRLAGQFDHTGPFLKTVYYTPFTVDQNGVASPGVRSTGRPVDEFDSKAFRASFLFDTDRLKNVTVVDWTRVQGNPNVLLTDLLPEGIRGGTPAIIFFPPSVITGALGPLLGGNIVNLVQCPSGAINCNVYSALAAQQANPDTNFRDTPAFADIKLWGVSNATTLKLNDTLSLKNIFGLRSIHSISSTDFDGTPIVLLASGARNDLQVMTEELQLSGNLTEQLKFVLGGFYYHSKPNGPGGAESFNSVVYAGLVNSTQGTYVEDISKAIYGQADYDLSALVKGLSFTAGYRYTWDQSKGCVANVEYSPFGGGEIPGQLNYLPGYSNCRAGNFAGAPSVGVTANGLPTGPTSEIAANYDVSFSKPTYTLSVNWQITDSTLAYIAHRRGYRGGGFNYSNVPAPYQSLQTYGPETLTDWELGLKTHWRAGDVRGAFNGALFRGIDKGYQYQQSTTGVGTLPVSGLIINKADLRIQGFEADTTLNWGGLTVGADAAYTEIAIERLTIPQALLDAFAAFGQAPPLVTAISNQPKWQTNANVSYELPDEVLGGRLSFDANFHYQTSFRTSETVVGGYHTLDGQIVLANLGGKPVDVRVFMRNILDARYFSGTASSATIGFFSKVLAPPRTVGVAVRYQFGT